MRCKYAFEPLVNLFWYYTGCFSLNYFCTNGCKANASLYIYFLLSCGVISRLRNIDNGADQSKYSSLIDCMCRWGQVGHIMELVCDWLSDTLTRRKVCICMCQRIKELLDYIKASCFFFFLIEASLRPFYSALKLVITILSVVLFLCFLLV